MPIRPEMRHHYRGDWPLISARIRFGRAGGKCEWCGAIHGHPHPETGSKVVLTTAHLDHDPTHNDESNLAGLCQKCHNGHDAGKRQGNRRRREREGAGQLAFVFPA